ncbi:MAG: efflux RND transporter permease subunit [Steroidobacteraceae bacterium]|jgi:HAE1 family hydrophobic/amphiphilic exporter-1|nr:efflux RND transporter permease subunit [Steroidobacteraceae bacterium]
MTIVDFATRRRVTVLMITLAIVLFGFVSLTRLKLNLLPDLSYPTLTVRTDLTGAAPVELETLVTRPIEEAVGVIRNVQQVQSVSRAGQSDVILEFAWGTDMDLAGIDVREKLDVLQLPLESSRPLLLRFDPSTEPVMRLAFRNEAGEAADPVARIERLKALRRFADDRLKPALEAVPGSAAIKVSGGYEDEIQVLVDQRKLAQLGLSIETVSRRLREENINLSGGRLEQGTQRFLVRTLNEFTSVPQMADAILANVEGRPVYLRDVAEVRQGYKEREAITRVDGTESVELAVYKEGDANTVQLAHALAAEIEQLGKSLPPGSRLDVVYDQSRFIDSAISEVREAAILGGLLAILVLYLFLRDARATLITGVAIPVSVIGTFLLMYAFDLSLNIMSLGGIALAVGMLVDNAVVVLESIVRHREAGASRIEAARRGTTEVGTAVMAATLTSVAVFFPMVFISGVAGQLFRDQALTVTFALLFSLVVAITLVPMLAAGRPEHAADGSPQPAPGRVGRGLAAVVRVLRRAGGHLSTLLAHLFAPAAHATQIGYRAVERAYLPALRWSLAHRGRVVAAAVVVLVATTALVPRLGSELIPQLSQGEFLVDLRLPPGSPLEQTDRVMAAAQGMAMELPGVRRVYAVTGTGNRLDANPTDAGDNTGRLTVLLEPGSGRAEEQAAIAGLRSRLDALAGVQYQFSRPALFSFDTPLEVVVAGYDLERLRGVAAEVRSALEANGRFSDVKSTVEAGNPEIQIIFDQQRAAQLGLTVRELADRVVSSVRGDVATRYKLRERNIDVLVRSVDTRSASVEEIRGLIVNPGSERPVPLEAVAEVRVATGPAEVRRMKQERVAIVSANLAGGDLGSAVAELERIVAGIELPVETTIAVSGQSSDMRESFVSLQFALLMAVFLVYLVMASQFESLLHPFVILLTIPLALVGSVWAMYLTGTTVNVVAYIGLIMLAGIVVNQSIVLIDAVNQARERGADKHAAILEAGRTRLRPILITKLTTILGLMPMALGLGDGAEIRQPMAVTVIGGVAVASVFTLLVIPVVYSLLDRKRFAPAALDERLDGTAEA